MNTQAPLTVLVDADADAIEAHIRDHRADALAVFAPLAESQRTGLVTDAWTIGLRAVTNAHRLAEESRLQDIGKALLEDVDAELHECVRRQQEAVVQALQRYFDPNDGQVVTRIDGFLKDGGELTRAMDKFLGPEHGVLATTLAKALGETSPLLRRLSPTDSEGVVALVEARVRDALETNRTAVARALDPLAPDGAVARFLASLKKDLEKADGERTKQLALATKALDANDETSLLSRLVRETQAARATVLEAMNPDASGSPLAILKTSLTSMLETHAKSQAEVMTAFDERQKKLDQDIREVVARLEEGRRRDASSPRGGRRFEDQVCLFTHNALTGAPVFIEDTGATVGARSACKVGDQVIRFNGESIYAGAAVVIEAKREAGCTMPKALAELETARSNRTAQAGVFVLAKSHASTGFPGFSRCGNDVVVIWDENDEMTDAYLQAALLLALGLATRQRRGDDEGNIKALADIEQKIERELKRHAKMHDLVESIQGKADDLAEELRKGTKGLKALVKDAKATLKALNVELATMEEERAEPLSLPAGELAQARASLVSAAE
jgi:hypothetical protein